jgi:hypothetical protein
MKISCSFNALAALVWLGAMNPIFAAETNATRPTLFIIGDSTVKNSGQGLQGWGSPIQYFLTRTKSPSPITPSAGAAAARFSPKAAGMSC